MYDLYRGWLTEEIHAVEKALKILEWLNSPNDTKFPFSADEVHNTVTCLLCMAESHHRFDSKDREARDYDMIISATEKDFFGSLSFMSLVYKLDTIYSILKDNQDLQE